jgi:diphosphomevalonate decarboxylase
VGPRLHAELKSALVARDFERFGDVAEKSALAMHASAFAAGVIYFQGPTLDVLAAVRQLRGRGTPVFATMDAGPHVKVLVRPSDSALAGTWLRAVPGVGRVFEAKPAEGARLIDAPVEVEP